MYFYKEAKYRINEDEWQNGLSCRKAHHCPSLRGLYDTV